jgi:hypothetical protein
MGQAGRRNSNATTLAGGAGSKSFRESRHRPTGFFLHGIAIIAPGKLERNHADALPMKSPGILQFQDRSRREA